MCCNVLSYFQMIGYTLNDFQLIKKIFCRFNSMASSVRKPKLGTAKTVSRNFNFMTSQKIRDLKQVKLKQRTMSKVNWAVKAYCDWREVRLSNAYHEVIFKANLNDLSNLEEESLCGSLCHFIPEVTKSKGEGMYPAKTLYQMVVVIQKHLNVNRIGWKFLDDSQFEDVKIVLDNVMKERTLLNIGNVKKQADLITYDQENYLWKEGILGEQNPDQLPDTVLYLLGVHLALRAGDEHYYLRRPMPNKPSQLSFEHDSKGIRCLVYREDTCTKANDGGLKQMRKERKIVWVYPNSENVSRCPVHLVDKYIGLCPPYFKKENFYLQSLQNCNPAVWYAEQVVGINSLKKVVKNLLGKVNVEGYFTNHSLHRTGGTRLFQAGIERKIVKEITGHSSDAIDSYQITSDFQRAHASEVLGGEIKFKSKPQDKEIEEKVDVEPVIPIVSSVNVNGKTACSCNKTYSPKANDFSEMISNILENRKKGVRTSIKIQIDFDDE